LSECTIGQALATQSGRADEACEHVMKGIRILEKIGAQYDLARATLCEAQVRAAIGDRAGARRAADTAAKLLRTFRLEREESVARALMNELGEN
jgi:hypothetical protein